MLRSVLRRCLLSITIVLSLSYTYSDADPLIIHVTEIYEVGQGSVALTTSLPSPPAGEGLGVRGKITNQYIYSPYGTQKNLNHPITPLANTSYPSLFNQTRKPLNITHNQFGYTGQSADPSTSLMMLGGFRNYAPGIGRFIQPDTYNSFSKHAINNPNVYVNGNPLSLTDPSGHFSIGDVWNDVQSYGFPLLAIAGGIGGAALSGGTYLSIAGEFLGAGSGLTGLASSISMQMGHRTLGEVFSYESMGLGALGSLDGMALAVNIDSRVAKAGIVTLSAVGAGDMIGGIIAQASHNHQLARLTSDIGYATMGLGLFAGSNNFKVYDKMDTAWSIVSTDIKQKLSPIWQRITELCSSDENSEIPPPLISQKDPSVQEQSTLNSAQELPAYIQAIFNDNNISNDELKEKIIRANSEDSGKLKGLFNRYIDTAAHSRKEAVMKFILEEFQRSTPTKAGQE